MNNATANAKNRPGFTLLEVIVAMTLAAIMAAMLVPYMGTILVNSTEPVIMVQRNATLTRVMENMATDYKALMATDLTPLTTLTSRIQNGNDPDTSDPFYGYYSVVECQERELVSGENSRVLWVTIASGNQHLTALFTQ